MDTLGVENFTSRKGSMIFLRNTRISQFWDEGTWEPPLVNRTQKKKKKNGTYSIRTRSSNTFTIICHI